MRESCSCGAAVHVFSRRFAREWRYTHQHEPDLDAVDLHTRTEIPLGFTARDDEDD